MSDQALVRASDEPERTAIERVVGRLGHWLIYPVLAVALGEGLLGGVILDNHHHETNLAAAIHTLRSDEDSVTKDVRLLTSKLDELRHTVEELKSTTATQHDAPEPLDAEELLRGACLCTQGTLREPCRVSKACDQNALKECHLAFKGYTCQPY
jgi:hypothetical protein